MKAGRKNNLGKIFLVIFLRSLIWVWADLSMDKELPDKTAIVEVDKSANPKLWVHFNSKPRAAIRVTLSGPQSAIVELDRNLKIGKEKLIFDLNVKQEILDTPGPHRLELLPFLQKEKSIRERGMKVIGCDPNMLEFEVVKLVEKPLHVRCIEEDGTVILGVTVVPERVDMDVPEDWRGDADVVLREWDKQQARQDKDGIVRYPYVKLPGNVEWEVPKSVNIKLTAQEDLLQPETIQAPKLGIAKSPWMEGNYKVEVDEDDLKELINSVKIRATSQARDAYKSMEFQIILEILDSDVGKPSQWRRPVIYNFPEDKVRKNQIILNQSPKEAKFTLIPLESDEQKQE
jgi:hypothetical protein